MLEEVAMITLKISRGDEASIELEYDSDEKLRRGMSEFATLIRMCGGFEQMLEFLRDNVDEALQIAVRRREDGRL